VERERELKLGAEERSVGLQQKTNLNAEAVAQLCREQDELRQTTERLCSERDAARGERDQAVREHDETQQRIGSLQADLGTVVARRLEAKSVSAGLVTELAEAQRILQAESDEHDLLCAVVGVVFDDLEVARLEGTSSLAAHAVDITARVHQLEREALCSGITEAFAIACSHYVDSIDLETMSLGFMPSYEAFEPDEIEKEVAPIARKLANKVEDIVLPRRG